MRAALTFLPVHVQIHEVHEAKSTTEEVIRSKENIVNFIEALEALQFPTSGIFSCADVESTGWEDRCCLCQLAGYRWSPSCITCMGSRGTGCYKTADDQ